MITSQQNKKINIGKRLKTVAETAAVRLSCEKNNDALCAVDVGTDHAKLPMYLVSELGFEHVTATDINEGPCRAARENINAAGSFFAQKIDVVKTDGLNGLDGIKTNRVIVAGMGGELIVHILSDAAFVRNEPEHIGFVLQPQSKEHLLRRYLYTEGYRITDEVRVVDAGKLYCVISAVYDGVKRQAELLELYFGKPGLERCDELFLKDFLKKYRILHKNLNARQGKQEVGREEIYDEEHNLFLQMNQYIERKCLNACLE